MSEGHKEVYYVFSVTTTLIYQFPFGFELDF